MPVFMLAGHFPLKRRRRRLGIARATWRGGVGPIRKTDRVSYGRRAVSIHI